MTTQLKETVSAWPSSNPVFKPNANDAEKRIRVAFVEDDDDFREAVSSELGDYGFDVTSFPDGAQLIEAFDKGDLDSEIIVLDWSLPSVAGIDLLPKLRRMGVVLPVVFLTGRTQPAYEKLARDVTYCSEVVAINVARDLASALIDPAIAGTAAGLTWRLATGGWSGW